MTFHDPSFDYGDPEACEPRTGLLRYLISLSADQETPSELYRQARYSWNLNMIFPERMRLAAAVFAIASRHQVRR